MLKNPPKNSNPYYTSDWLQAIVTPVTDPNNYRPISLTCTSCRVMERVINSKLIDYLLQNNLITRHQHGFLKKTFYMYQSTGDYT